MAVSQLPYGQPAGSRVWGGLVIVGAGIGLLLLFALLTTGGVAVLLGLFVAAAICYCAWRWPLQTVIALMVFLPLSRFISFGAFAVTDSGLVLRASQLWKDAVLVVLVLRLTHDSFTRGKVPHLYLIDLLVFFYIVLTAVYVLYPGDGEGSTYNVRFLAFRQDAFYLLAFFVGRGLTFERRHLRQMLLALAAVSFVIAVVAVWQFAMPNFSNAVFQKLGYARFTEAVGTPHETELVRSRIVGGGEIPRASSLFLADLGLAFFQVMMIPLAAGIFFCVRSTGARALASGLFLVLMIGTMGLTVTRAPIVAAGIVLLLMIIVSRSFIRASWVGAAVVALMLAFLLVSGFGMGSLNELFSTEESSALAHTELIQESTEIIGQNPLGLGLGNGSHVAVLTASTSSVPAWATETWYLQLGMEMGLAGMVLFTAVLVTVSAASFINSSRVNDPWLRALTLGIAGAGLGFIIVGAFHPVWAAVQIAYVFWIFAGIAVRGPELDRHWRAREGVGS
jgi:hypothetical protein